MGRMGPIRGNRTYEHVLHNPAKSPGAARLFSVNLALSSRRWRPVLSISQKPSIPPFMSSFAMLAESRIQEALEAGKDRELARKGIALDLDAYFAAPSSLRAGFGVLKSAGVVPPEVEAMKQVAVLREKLASTSDPVQIEALRKELHTREVELALGMERMKRSLKADIVFD